MYHLAPPHPARPSPAAGQQAAGAPCPRSPSQLALRLGPERPGPGSSLSRTGPSPALALTCRRFTREAGPGRALHALRCPRQPPPAPAAACAARRRRERPRGVVGLRAASPWPRLRRQPGLGLCSVPCLPPAKAWGHFV